MTHDTSEAGRNALIGRANSYSCWRQLTSAFGVAITWRCLLLATMGVFASSLLWLGLAKLFSVDAVSNRSLAISQLQTVQRLGELTGATPDSLPDSILDVPMKFTTPFVRLFQTDASWREIGYNASGGVGAVLIWSFFGLAISRIAMFHCGKSFELGLREGLRFSKRKWSSVAGSVFATLIAIAAIGLPVMALGWLVRSDVGILLMACLWGVMLVIVALMAVLALGLLLGWPLMWSAIAAEDSDLFDAISRSFAYTYQRPLHYLWFGLIFAGLGLLGWAVSTVFAEMVVELTYWCVQVSGGASRLEIFRDVSLKNRDVESTHLQNAGYMMNVWENVVRIVASAFSYSFFWTATASIYLMLRWETDDTPIDDIIENSQ